MNIDILSELKSKNALIEKDHFIYASGKHGATYLNKDGLYVYPTLISAICAETAKHFESKRIDIVIGPVLGGITLSQYTAWHLSKLNNRDVLSLFLEKGISKDGESYFSVTRGNDRFLTPDFFNGRKPNILITEDILTTGSSVKKVLNTLSHYPIHIAGISALVNRGNVQLEDLGIAIDPSEIDFYCQSRINIQTYDKAECPMCKAGIPVNTSLGKGSK